MRKAAARILFGLLVVATVAAFFVAQRLKNTPSIIQGVRHPTVVSPNGDGRHDTVAFSLRLKEADRVTLTILDGDGDSVGTVLDDRRLAAYETLRGTEATWDGRDSSGRVVPDGLYRLRITLREQGRSAVDQTSVTVDTTPPKPTVARVEPSENGAAILPRANGGDVTAFFNPALKDATISVFQTSPVRREVLTEQLELKASQWSWDGTVDGARVSQGTYVIVPSWRDKAGNVGTGVPIDDQGLPDLRKRWAGKGGVTVRYASAAAPVAAVKAGTRVNFGVDTRGERYSWSLRQPGRGAIKRGRGVGSPLTVTVPRSFAGLYELRVQAGSHAASAPLIVAARKPAGGNVDDPRGVLVVVPTMTWQGRNEVDDDGDGAPNLLDNGSSARLLQSAGRQRAFGGDGMPFGIEDHEAQVFNWLGENKHRYDVATDVQLQADSRLLSGYRGVILPGDTRWLTRETRSRLTRFVGAGGTLLSLGTESLRRSVVYSRDGLLTKPSRPARADIFGALIARRETQPVGLEIFGDDQVGLFGDTPGSFDAVTGWEQTAKVGADAEQVAGAVTIDPPGKTVTVAVKYGEGLVIRPGFDSFLPRLNSDPAIRGLMDGAWVLLSR